MKRNGYSNIVLIIAFIIAILYDTYLTDYVQQLANSYSMILWLFYHFIPLIILGLLFGIHGVIKTQNSIFFETILSLFCAILVFLNLSFVIFLKGYIGISLLFGYCIGSCTKKIFDY